MKIDDLDWRQFYHLILYLPWIYHIIFGTLENLPLFFGPGPIDLIRDDPTITMTPTLPDITSTPTTASTAPTAKGALGEDIETMKAAAALSFLSESAHVAAFALEDEDESGPPPPPPPSPPSTRRRTSSYGVESRQLKLRLSDNIGTETEKPRSSRKVTPRSTRYSPPARTQPTATRRAATVFKRTPTSLDSRRTSRYKGVSKDRDKWRARVHVKGRCYWIGTYATEVQAAKAYNDAATDLFGVGAELNDLSEFEMVTDGPPGE
ncbi:hypothetical protein SeMB42_g02786 [Synchytrium endobioticum]|uniref:AP2/ERF domain-containing protein n=1 Tax=Synchytrium endobioticum TaxID=286115 RepID=A0A507DDQ6_9FUNG|nr:hypothetical protein SeMB42_g02786 [Synchytrium endobioticum]